MSYFAKKRRARALSGLGMWGVPPPAPTSADLPPPQPLSVGPGAAPSAGGAVTAYNEMTGVGPGTAGPQPTTSLVAAAQSFDRTTLIVGAAALLGVAYLFTRKG